MTALSPTSRTRACAVATLLLMASAVALAPGARADAVLAGWWTSSPLPIGVDAGDDGLFVQAGPDPGAPLAFAALVIPLERDETAVRLTLTVAEGSVSTSMTELKACPLVGELEPASGGSMDDAPEYDCETHLTAFDDGGVYSFFIGALAEDDRLAIALLPTAPIDRVVLDAPAADALQTRQSLSSAPTGPAGAGEAGGPGAVVPPPEPPAAGGGVVTPPPPAQQPSIRPPRTGAPPSLPEQETPAPEPRETADQPADLGPTPGLAAATRPPIEDANPVAVIGFLGLTAAAGTLWFRAGRADLPDAEATVPASP